jgi:transcription antitermination factor NusG
MEGAAATHGQPDRSSEACASPRPVGAFATRSGAGGRWYVAQTLARREIGAAAQLERQGFRTFLPQMLKTVRHARQLRTVRAAVFPGYVFVGLDLTRDRWRAVNGTMNVSRLVMGEDMPLPVPRGVVETLMTYRDSSGVCRFDRDLQAGELVRVVAGPFAQALGRIASLDDKGRARVLLEIMSGTIIATLERAGLERA